ncbi:MAG: hypothetical protein DRQ55_12900 [Planctomycetota bacterium]|nr:MAG: hypothetical protein DRQ55_12900 [Planctomycetota bacterium]
MMRPATSFLLLLALFAAAPTAAASPDDARLARKVRQAITGSVNGRLLTAERVSARAKGRSDLDLARDASSAITRALGTRVRGLTVSASDGVIELRGAVRDADAARTALELATAVPGAHGVRSTLDGARVEPLPVDPAAPFSFATDSLLGGHGLSVQVRGGVVQLTGEVNGSEARRFVLNATRSVRGVRSVSHSLTQRDVSVETDAGLLALLTYRMRKSVDLHHVWQDLDLSVRAGVVRVSGRVDQEWERDLVELTLLSARAVMVVVSDVELAGGEPLVARRAD